MTWTDVVNSWLFGEMGGFGSGVLIVLETLSNAVGVVIPSVVSNSDAIALIAAGGSLWYIMYATYQKNFNLFTRVYSYQPINIVAFIVEGAIAVCVTALLIMVAFETTIFAGMISREFYKLKVIIMPVLVVLIWRCIETRLFPVRYDIKLRYRTSSWTLLYFLERYVFLISRRTAEYLPYLKKEYVENELKAVQVSVEEKRSRYFDTAAALEQFYIQEEIKGDASINDVRYIKLSGANRFLLRYHELFGKVGVVQLIARILYAPIVAIAIGALLSGIIAYALRGEGEIISDLYEFASAIAAAFGGLNAIFFGPAFMPYDIRWTIIGRDDLLSFVAVSRLTFCMILLSALSRSSNAGYILTGSLAIYTSLFFWFVRWFSIEHTGTYFDDVAGYIDNVATGNRWISWMLTFSGFSGLTNQLRNVTDEQFIMMTIPGLIFWCVVTLLVLYSVRYTWAGRITYRGEFVLLPIARGRDLPEKLDVARQFIAQAENELRLATRPKAQKAEAAAQGAEHPQQPDRAPQEAAATAEPVPAPPAEPDAAPRPEAWRTEPQNVAYVNPDPALRVTQQDRPVAPSPPRYVQEAPRPEAWRTEPQSVAYVNPDPALRVTQQDRPVAPSPPRYVQEAPQGLAGVLRRWLFRELP